MNFDKNEISKKYNGIELDITKRWETGIEHHPKSIEMIERIMELDWHFQSDLFCWKKGGDGERKKQNLDHLVYKYIEQKLVCEACKGFYVMTLPLSANAVTKIFKAFQTLHGDCKT